MVAIMPFMLVFRFLHIAAGALWLGRRSCSSGYIGPSAAEVGPAAGPLLSAAVAKRKVAKVVTGLAGTTVVAGWILWLHDMGDRGSLGDWLSSRFGLVLTIGGVLATIAFIEGSFGVGRNIERMVHVGDTVRASGGPPSPEQQAQLEHLGAELKRYGQVDLVLLLLAVAAMSTARYW
jgi:small-conductance mechanosensitive channel